MKRIIYIILGIILLTALVLLVTNKNGKNSNELPIPSAFDNTQYRLSLYNGMQIPEGTDYLVTFVDGRVSSTFCNGVGGMFTATDTTITSSQMISTMMYCSEPEYLMNLENSFSTLFGEEGANYLLEGELLTLSKGDTIMLFTVVR